MGKSLGKAIYKNSAKLVIAGLTASLGLTAIDTVNTQNVSANNHSLKITGVKKNYTYDGAPFSIKGHTKPGSKVYLYGDYDVSEGDKPTYGDKLMHTTANKSGNFSFKVKDDEAFSYDLKIVAKNDGKKATKKTSYKESARLASSYSAEISSLDAASSSREAAKNNPDTYTTGITFDQISRTPDDYDGAKMSFTGSVMQALEDDGITQVLLAVDGNTDNTLMVNISDKVRGDSRILEDDLLTVYGTSQNTITYESVNNEDITVPLMKAKIVENKGPASDDYGY